MASPSLGRRALKSSIFELAGFGGGLALRLASTLVLTRLLFPEAFGLAALVFLFTSGLGMLSDVGLVQSVVQNSRGDEPRFLNTAWTMQVIRGGSLWVAACVIAWPVSILYHEPDLLLLLPVGSLAALISGFSSTRLFTLRRRMSSAPLVRIDLTAQAVGLLVIVPWAYWYPSAWAIVAGGLSSALYRTAASYRVHVGHRNRFEWDPQAKAAILGFGKWIFGSSALDFLGRQGDRLLLGYYLGVAVLGFYSIAAMIADALGAAVARICHGVLFSAFSEAWRESPSRLSDMYYKARLRLDCLSLLPIGMVLVMSQTIIDILYDPRYREAGWMLQALCVRAAMGVVLVPLTTYLLSIGHPRYAIYQHLSRTIWVFAGIPLVWPFFGVEGIVWVSALSQLPALVILWVGTVRLGILRPLREAFAPLMLLAGAILGLAVDAGVQAAAHWIGRHVA